MADTDALRKAATAVNEKAKAVNNEAETLSSEVAREVQAMKQAIKRGEETLNLIEQIEMKMAKSDHAQYLKDESQKSPVMQQQAVETLQSMDDISHQLTELIMPHLLEPPTETSLPSKSYEPATFPSLPDFQVPNREELESLPLPSLQQNEAAWDMLAQEFTTVEEQFEASLQEAEQLAQAAQEKLREVEKPQQPEKTVQHSKNQKAAKISH